MNNVYFISVYTKYVDINRYSRGKRASNSETENKID